MQSLDSLSGKILRIDPATGLGLSDNPFVTSGVALDSNRAKVYQLGFRNPFSVTFAPDGRLFDRRHRLELLGGDRQRRPGREFRLAVLSRAAMAACRLRTPSYSDLAAAQAFYKQSTTAPPP